MIDGEEAYISGDYQKAQESYQKAIKEAKKEMDFYDLLNQESLTTKQQMFQDASYVESLMALAEAQVGLSDYVGAAESYSQAKQIAIENGDKTAIDEINLKIKEMQTSMEEEMQQQMTQQQEAEQEQKDQLQKDGEVIELEGDTLLAEGNIDTAKKYYQQAMQMYKEAGAIDKASAVQTKIIDADSSAKEQDNLIKATEGDVYMLNGDNLMLENKFQEAIEEYKKAKDIYSQIQDSDKITEITEKITTAQTRQKETDITAQKMDIGIIEARGDEALKLQQYGKAKEFYLQAQALYQGINDMEKVASMQEKIKIVQQLEEQTAQTTQE